LNSFRILVVLGLILNSCLSLSVNTKKVDDMIMDKQRKKHFITDLYFILKFKFKNHTEQNQLTIF
jgi:hypothetical protein